MKVINSCGYKTTQITNNYMLAIKAKYNIIGHLNIIQFDSNFHELVEFLDEIRKDKFEENDRILIEHFDTDFYPSNNDSFGIFLYNLVEAFLKSNTPLYILLFLTNHFGIKREFDTLLRNHNKNDYPSIIETFISTKSYPSDFTFAHDNSNIHKHAICMMSGTERSHRSAIYNKMNEFKLLSKIAVSIRGLQ